MGYILCFVWGILITLMSVSITMIPTEYAQAEKLCAANGGIKSYRLAMWEDPSVTCNNDGNFRVKVEK